MVFEKKGRNASEKVTVLEKHDVDIIIRGMNLFFLSLSRHIVDVLINKEKEYMKKSRGKTKDGGKMIGSSFVCYKIKNVDWERIKKTLLEINDECFVFFYNFDHCLSKVLDTCTSLEEELEVLEDYYKKEHNIDKKDIPNIIRISILCEGKEQEVEIRYGKEACVSTNALPLFNKLLEKMGIKVIKNDGEKHY